MRRSKGCRHGRYRRRVRLRGYQVEVGDRGRDTAGTPTLRLTANVLISLARPRGFEPLLPP
jgi:hypothetical protein